MNLTQTIQWLNDMGWIIFNRDSFYVALQEDERIDDWLFNHGSSQEVAELIDQYPTEYVKKGVMRHA